MKFIFKDSKTNTEVALPVTPPSFEVSYGIRVETINIHAVGDVAIGGYGTLCTVKVECMLPSRQYSFAAKTGIKPYDYVEKFRKWCEDRAVLRFVLTGTPVNMPVLISDVKYGERDGTGDVYASLSLREYRALEAATVQTQKNVQTGNKAREETTPPATPETYTVVSGDTLWAIARKFYGDGALCWALAAYNGIKNANILSIGQVIKIPDKALLDAVPESDRTATVGTAAAAAIRGGGGGGKVVATER